MNTKNEWGFVLLSENDDPEQRAIKRLQLASDMSLNYYGTPLVVTTSGGKDSSVCVELARRAGIPFEVQHSHTTADAPETVYFVRDEFTRLEALGIPCKINKPTYQGRPTSMWDFLRDAKVPVNPLYACGFSRVGCIGCPMASKKRYKEFRHWPAYEKLYIQAFDNMLDERKRRGKKCDWQTGRDVFRWWMEEDTLPGQMSIEDFAQ